jgi:DNA-binding IclR family transcriptional regulator
MGDGAKHPVRTTSRTIEIVEGLKRLGGAGVTELADELGTTKSTVHNHLSTLEEHEYVINDGGTYSLGLRFLELGGYTRNDMKLFEMGKPEVDALAEETGELVNLAVEEHGKCVYLYRAKGSRSVHLDIHVGERMALHTTALGKAMLAHVSDRRLEEFLETTTLEAATDHSITDPDALREELATVRERGYAVDDEERVTGLRCVAAPILHEETAVVGAISVSAPTSRLKGERLAEEIPEAVNSAANVIELNVANA